MATCTIFKNFSTPVINYSLIVISGIIASDKYKNEVEQIQSLIAQGKEEEADLIKKSLLAFTPSGTFKEHRNKENLDQYSGFVHLDFDDVEKEKLEVAFKTIASIPYTFLCFRSPSGNGLKVFIEVNSSAEQHEMAIEQVKQLYEKATGLKADEKCKDVARLCFFSHDPQLFKNIQNPKFQVQQIQPSKKQQPASTQPMPISEEQDYLQSLQECKLFTEQKSNFAEGNRNNFIFQFASNTNRKGIPKDIALMYACNNFEFNQQEIVAAFKSAYTNHAHEFAKFANVATLQTEVENSSEDYLRTTPTIPDDVFEALPDLLKEAVIAFPDRRKRDVFFTGALPILSGCLPNVTGIYFQERVFPHLYTFIIAPAASGKGVLKNAKRLADKYHTKILEESKAAQKHFEAEMTLYKDQLHKKKKGDAMPEAPDEPAFKIIFIPANCSQARMVEHLQNNDGQGIICETEADTMSGAKKQDWGDYSSILRAAFHHEKISLTRKTGNEYIEINLPQLAVALSGTPAQVPRLIGSAEDGLFSRFLFYAFKNDIVWQDPSPNNQTIIYNDHFEKLSETVLNMVSFFENSKTDIQLQPQQWQAINTVFPQMLSDVAIFTSEDAAGIVYRLGLIQFRLCMIFSALRKFENGEMTETIFCTDEDFNTALSIVKTYLQHSILMFNNLPKQTEAIPFLSGDSKRKFFEALPLEFTRQEAVALGNSFKLSPRSVDDILKALLGKSLEKIKAGHYRKNQSSQS